MPNALQDNTQKHRYELEVDGQIVFADYRKEGDVVHILNVEAPPALRGKGAAGQFMHAMMEHLRTQKLTMFPICSYAIAWLARNREYQDLLE